MAKVTNFLSIALLVSVLAVSPVFAAGEDVVVPAAPVAAAADAEPAPLGAPAGDAAAETWACAIANNVDKATNKVLDVATWGCPFAYFKGAQAQHPTIARTLVTTTVVALVVTNPAVQGAVNTVVDSVKAVLGLTEDDSDEHTTEPTRLVIGRQA